MQLEYVPGWSGPRLDNLCRPAGLAPPHRALCPQAHYPRTLFEFPAAIRPAWPGPNIQQATIRHPTRSHGRGLPASNSNNTIPHLTRTHRELEIRKMDRFRLRMVIALTRTTRSSGLPVNDTVAGGRGSGVADVESSAARDAAMRLGEIFPGV